MNLIAFDEYYQKCILKSYSYLIFNNKINEKVIYLQEKLKIKIIEFNPNKIILSITLQIKIFLRYLELIISSLNIYDQSYY